MKEARDAVINHANISDEIKEFNQELKTMRKDNKLTLGK